MKKPHHIAHTDLIINPDGSIYHLNIRPEQIAHTILLVGDPERVTLISSRFDSIEIKENKREFVTHTGRIGNKRISVVSTGIGMDNIDIVINELDALVNIDFETYQIKDRLTHLNIIRLGTCGTLVKELAPGSLIISTAAILFDGLMHFYQIDLTEEEKKMQAAIKAHFVNIPAAKNVYIGKGSEELIEKFPPEFFRGITLTCTGFYGPQHRKLRAPLIGPNLLDIASNFSYEGQVIANLEMETAAIYALSKILLHKHVSTSVVVANRPTQTFSSNPEKDVNYLIEKVLTVLAESF